MRQKRYSLQVGAGFIFRRLFLFSEQVVSSQTRFLRSLCKRWSVPFDAYSWKGTNKILSVSSTSISPCTSRLRGKPWNESATHVNLYQKLNTSHDEKRDIPEHDSDCSHGTMWPVQYNREKTNMRRGSLVTLQSRKWLSATCFWHNDSDNCWPRQFEYNYSHEMKFICFLFQP